MTSVQLTLRLRLPGGSSFRNFIDGPNGPARHWVERMLDPGGPEAVYLWGPPGSGKTHLLEAAVRAFAERGGEVAYLPLAQPDRVDPSMLIGLEAMRLVCIDDIHGIAGRRDWEEALFHLLNRLRHSGRRWLASGRVGPATLPLSLPDLRSRVGGALTARLALLPEHERVEALKLRAKDRGFRLPDQVTRFLLRRFSRDPHALFAMLDDLDRLSLERGRRVTLPLVRALMGYGPARPPR